jgi:carbon monoxide dehydrogenase subunit G
MILTGSSSLAAAPDAVRAVLTDPRRLAQALPHVDAFGADVAQDGSFSLVIRPAIALGEIPIRTTWWPLRARPGAIAYRVEGRTDEHLITLATELTLLGDDPGTLAAWTVDCTTSGTIRSVGQRVLGAVITAQVTLALTAVDELAGAGPTSSA